MKVESKEFWEMVKNDYLNYYCRTIFICNSCPIFNEIWHSKDKSQKKIIVSLAKEFILATGTKTRVNHLNQLFNIYDMEIRKDFIKWCIQKYS